MLLAINHVLLFGNILTFLSAISNIEYKMYNAMSSTAMLLGMARCGCWNAHERGVQIFGFADRTRLVCGYLFDETRVYCMDDWTMLKKEILQRSDHRSTNIRNMHDRWTGISVIR